MATNQPINGADAISKSPQQENKDPCGLEKMFMEGVSKIDTHRSANLFEALEKRSLTDAEQAIIDERVAHQRKMFEVFEKREKERKVRELKEVCPDISDEEAAAALDLCDGKEDEAAAALVSDPSFKRRVQAACGLVPMPVSRQGSGAMSNRTSSRSTRPAGPRPKLIDPSTLGDSVFVGAFRGKGFQGVSKGSRLAKPAANKSRQAKNNNSPSETEKEEEQEEQEAMEIEEEAQPEELTNKSSEEVETPVEEDEEEEEPAAAPKATPASVPKQYALVRETSQGEVRPVTDSELKKAVVESEPAAVETIDEEEEEEEPLPTRASLRRASGAGANVSVSMLEKMVIKLSNMEDEAGAGWLAKMAPEMACNVLQMLGSENPERAVFLQELIEAQKAKIAAPSAATAVEEEKKEEPPRPAAAAQDGTESTGWDSEATKSEAPGTANGAAQDTEWRTTSRPRRNSNPPKKLYDLDIDDEDEPSPTRKRRVSSGGANKRRKSLTMTSPSAAVAAAAAMETDGGAAQPAPIAAPAAAGRRQGRAAISSRGHTNRGRVKQKSHKSADLVEVGTLHVAKGWHNAGYIFPEGFRSRTLFRSSVALDQLCVHECYIIGKGGKYFPEPTFKVVSLDRPDEPIIAKSCTGCWTGILKRINAEIEARRQAGEDLPPPPKTAIAGPEYFGLNQPNIQEAIEELDPEHECQQYWAGKEERELAAAGLPVVPTAGANRAPRAPRAATAPRRTGTGRGRGRRNSAGSDDEDEHNASDVDEGQYMTNRWSAVSRTDRYRKRLEENGDDTTNIDADNPVPELIDPITLEPVVRPAISPYGHVMGAATWKAVLAEKGVCPFTKQPLKWEQCRILTHNNIEAYRDKIIR